MCKVIVHKNSKIQKLCKIYLHKNICIDRERDNMYNLKQMLQNVCFINKEVTCRRKLNSQKEKLLKQH